MQIAIQVDDGDEVSISADVISTEQALVTLQIENALYDSVAEPEAITLTVDKARDLAWALLSMADAIEFVSAPVTEVLSAINSLRSQRMN
jgi:hypothetical protein